MCGRCREATCCLVLITFANDAWNHLHQEELDGTSKTEGALLGAFLLLLRERETQRWSGSGGCSLLIAECCIGKTKLLWSMWWWYDHHDTSCIEYMVTAWSSVHPFHCPQASPPLQCPEWGWKPLSLLRRVILQRNVAHSACPDPHPFLVFTPNHTRRGILPCQRVYMCGDTHTTGVICLHQPPWVQVVGQRRWRNPNVRTEWGATS